MKKLIQSREALIIAILIFIFAALAVTQFYVSAFYKQGQGFIWDGNAKTTKGLPLMFANFGFYHSGYRMDSFERNLMFHGDSLDRWISCGGYSKELYPDSLKLLYYSFSESKFYEGNFKLDYDSIQRLATTMRNAVQQKGSNLNLGISFWAIVYPRGKIIVSMESGIETSVHEVIIAQFQAKPAVYDWSVFGNDIYSDNEFKEKGISKSKSVAMQRALLLNKYNWQVEVLLPKEHQLSELEVGVFGNGGVKMDTVKNAKTPSFGNFVYMPQQLSLRWKRADTIEFSTSFKFDEQEIIKAFSSIDTLNSKCPITMQIIVKDDTSALRAVLRGSGKSITLKNMNVKEIYNRKIYH